MSRENLDKWTEQWEKAQKDGIFKSEKPHIPTEQENYENFFGSLHPAKSTDLKDVDAQYWNKVYKMSNHSGDSPDPLADEVLMEADDNWGTGEDPMKDGDKNRKVEPQTAAPILGSQRSTPKKEDLSVKAAELGNTANPIHPWTRGKDQRQHVTPDWSDGPKLAEITNMKFNLYQLEGKLNADPNFGSYKGDTDKIRKIQTQIDELKARIDYLSNSLSPDFLEDEWS